MKMLKRMILSQKVVLFLLMLICGNSSYLFSANSQSTKSEIAEVYQDVISANNIDEQVNNPFDSLLPGQRDLLFIKGSLGSVGNYRSIILCHTSTSLNYIKRCRNIFPNLGIKKVIFPFHVFL